MTGYEDVTQQLVIPINTCLSLKPYRKGRSA